MILNYMAIPGIPKATNRSKTRHINVYMPEIIIKACCEYYNLTIEELQAKTRRRERVFPRHNYVYAG